MIKLKLSNGMEINLRLDKIIYTFHTSAIQHGKASYKVFLGIEIIELASESQFDELNAALDFQYNFAKRIPYNG